METNESEDLLGQFRAVEELGPCVRLGSSQPFMVEFRKDRESSSLRYALLNQIEYTRAHNDGPEPQDELVLVFSGMKVTVLGEKLERLHDLLLECAVVLVTTTKSATSGPQPWIKQIILEAPSAPLCV